MIIVGSSMVINLAVSILLGSVLSFLWDTINSMQIMFYLPLIGLPFPKIMSRSFRQIKYAVILNLELPNYILSHLIDKNEVKNQPHTIHFEEFGIESNVFVIEYS